MPSRLSSIAILILWASAALALFTRDLKPTLVLGPPPDMRTIVAADQDDEPTDWAILVPDPKDPLAMQTIGMAETKTKRISDGRVRLSSRCWFEAGELLKDTPLASEQNERIEILGDCDIDPMGNLDFFRVGVRLEGGTQDIMILSGQVQRNDLHVKVEGPLPILNRTWDIPYQPHGVVENMLGPIDRLPGLQVGQRWVSRVVSPLTGRIEEAEAEVTRKHVITWDNNPVTTFEVLTRMPPLSSRTWVRPDGLVLRQEVPILFKKIYLERIPKQDPANKELRR